MPSFPQHCGIFLLGRVMSRIRHCLECPRCRLRYLISLAPYENGSYVVTAVNGSAEEYLLFCSPCRLGSRRSMPEVMLCEVSEPAYRRGFGTEKEVWWLRPEPSHPEDITGTHSPSNWTGALNRNDRYPDRKPGPS